jgi:hypothetical protein
MCFVHPDVFLNHCLQYLHFTEVGEIVPCQLCLQELLEDEDMRPELEKCIRERLAQKSWNREFGETRTH